MWLLSRFYISEDLWPNLIPINLYSIQEARRLAEAGHQAQLIWGRATQEEVDQYALRWQRRVTVLQSG